MMQAAKKEEQIVLAAILIERMESEAR